MPSCGGNERRLFGCFFSRGAHSRLVWGAKNDYNARRQRTEQEVTAVYEVAEQAFQLVVRYAILVLEAVGALIIIGYSALSVVRMLQRKKKAGHEALTEGVTSGLSFLLGSEVLKTIVAPGWTDIGMTCAIILMRAGVTVLLKWENKTD